jgi:hypothetical protein
MPTTEGGRRHATTTGIHAPDQLAADGRERTADHIRHAWAPTLEERRRYAQAVQRAAAPAPLTPEQQTARHAELQRRRELLAELGVYVDD